VKPFFTALQEMSCGIKELPLETLLL